MREPKFRAWDIDKKEYISDFNISDNGVVWTQKHIDYDPEYPNCIVELPTGLKDKNGKEIYEGDVVDDGYSNICEIRWSEKLAGFKAVDEKDGYATNVWLVSEYGKVIGNIHENSELLGEKE